MSRHQELAFTGPATFFKAPQRSLADAWQADVAILGLPYDFAVGYRPGARFAPNALRAASGRFALPPDGWFDPVRQRSLLAGARVVDAGDVDPAQLEYRDTFRRITAAARRLRRRAGLPVFIGGDHSVTLPLLRAYHDVEELHVVQLDAHLDFSAARNASGYANSSPFRRASEELTGLRHITTLGLRGLRGDREAFAAAAERGHTLVSAAQIRSDPAAVVAALPRERTVYLSVDIDVLDPSLAPGTSSPEVAGLDYGQALALLAATIAHNEVVGIDLTELAPNLDPSDLTALVGARLLAETLALWWERRAR